MSWPAGRARCTDRQATVQEMMQHDSCRYDDVQRVGLPPHGDRDPRCARPSISGERPCPWSADRVRAIFAGRDACQRGSRPFHSAQWTAS